MLRLTLRHRPRRPTPERHRSRWRRPSSHLHRPSCCLPSQRHPSRCRRSHCHPSHCRRSRCCLPSSRRCLPIPSPSFHPKCGHRSRWCHRKSRSLRRCRAGPPCQSCLRCSSCRRYPTEFRRPRSNKRRSDQLTTRRSGKTGHCVCSFHLQRGGRRKARPGHARSSQTFLQTGDESRASVNLVPTVTRVHHFCPGTRVVVRSNDWRVAAVGRSRSRRRDDAHRERARDSAVMALQGGDSAAALEQPRPRTSVTSSPTAISPPWMTKQSSASLPSKRR